MTNNNFDQPSSLIKLSYETYGSGQPIIFLHGLGGTSYTWRNLIQALSAKNKLFLLDMKGFGRSEKPRDGKYSVHDQAGLVYQFILDHDLREVTLVGNSFGGGVALMTALKLTEEKQHRLASLILIDAAAYKQPLPSFLCLLRTPIIGVVGQYILPIESQIRSLLELAYYDRSKIPDSSVEVYSRALALPHARYATRQTARQIIPPDIDELTLRYKTIQVPTLVIWGRHDRIVPLWVGQKLKGDIPSSKLVIIENAGHMPQEETPEEVVLFIEDFLQGEKAL